MVKASPESEAGVMPKQEMLAKMMSFNEELAKAGVLLSGEGLEPSSKSARVKSQADERIVIDGPFAETKERIAGYWLWEVSSLEEAIDWVKRCPNSTGETGEIEIRPLFEAADFRAELTPELSERQKRLRANT